MPILLFLLDTSASMNQRTYLGTTYLDVAKGAVEVFMKVKNDFTPTFFFFFQARMHLFFNFFFFKEEALGFRLVEINYMLLFF